MKVRGLDHIGIAVEELTEAIAAYEALGLSSSGTEEVPTEGVRVAMLPTGATRIELLEPTTEESPVAKFLKRRGPGLHHIALAVDDVDEASAALRAAGVQLVYDQPQPGEGGTRVNFIHPKSAQGVLIELTEGRG